MCFNTHKAAEKAIKAAHVYHGIDYKWTHDIRRLIARLRSSGKDVPVELDDCEELTV